MSPITWGTALLPGDGGVDEDEAERARELERIRGKGARLEAKRRGAITPSGPGLVDVREEKLRQLADEQAKRVVHPSELALKGLLKGMEGLRWLTSQVESRSWLATAQAGEALGYNEPQPERLPGARIGPVYPSEQAREELLLRETDEAARKKSVLEATKGLSPWSLGQQFQIAEAYREHATPGEEFLTGSLMPGLGFVPGSLMTKPIGMAARGVLRAAPVVARGVGRGLEAVKPLAREFATSQAGMARLGKKFTQVLPEVTDFKTIIDPERNTLTATFKARPNVAVEMRTRSRVGSAGKTPEFAPNEFDINAEAKLVSETINEVDNALESADMRRAIKAAFRADWTEGRPKGQASITIILTDEAKDVGMGTAGDKSARVFWSPYSNRTLYEKGKSQYGELGIDPISTLAHEYHHALGGAGELDVFSDAIAAKIHLQHDLELIDPEYIKKWIWSEVSSLLRAPKGKFGMEAREALGFARNGNRELFDKLLSETGFSPDNLVTVNKQLEITTRKWAQLEKVHPAKPLPGQAAMPEAAAKAVVSVRQEETGGGIRTWWVRLPGEPERAVGEVGKYTREEAVVNAKRMADIIRRDEKSRQALQQKYPDRTVFEGNLPDRGLSFEGEPGRYFYVLAKRQKAGKGVVDDAVKIDLGQAAMPEAAAKADLARLQAEQKAFRDKVKAMSDKEYKPQAKALDKEDARLMNAIDEAEGAVVDAETAVEKGILPAAKAGEAGKPTAAGAPPKTPVEPSPVAKGPPPPEPPLPGRRRTLDEANATIGNAAKAFFGKESEAANEATLAMFRAQRAKRAADYSEQVELLRNDPALRNLSADEIEKRALQAMKGPLKRPEATLSKHITEDVSDAMFDKVFHTWHGVDAFEEMSTTEVLRHALRGEGIPRKRGILRSEAFPEGGSAYDRLLKVFGDQPELLGELEKGKGLDQIVEEKLLKSGVSPQGIDQEIGEYLRQLPTKPKGQGELFSGGVFTAPEGQVPHLWAEGAVRSGQELFEAIKAENITLHQDVMARIMARLDTAFRGTEGVTYQPPVAGAGQIVDIGTLWQNLGPERTTREIFGALKAENVKMRQDQMKRIFAELESRMKTQVPPGTVYQPPPIAKALKPNSMFPLDEQHKLAAMLKEAGLSITDIGNAIRSNVASFDNSWWRQAAPLILNHKRAFVAANRKSWHAVFNQKAADEAWQAMTKDPLYGLYEKLNIDFLRPLELPKGAPRGAGVEEYGFLTKERPIPNFMSKLPWVKLSQRGFVTGINEHTWRIFRDFYEQQLSISRRIAQNKEGFKTLESFDMEKNLKEMGNLLQDLSGRASLGKVGGAAPIMSGLAFAPRLALGRIISARHLWSASPYVRKEAWKDLATTIGIIGGMELLGEQAGLWRIEKDPRSPMFARIRVGNTIIDPWGGYQKYVRFVSQVVSRTGISATTGQKYDLSFSQATMRLLQGMEAPLISLATDVIEGKNFLGEPLDIKNPKQWIERIAPMATMDVYDAFVESGPAIGAVATPLTTVGLGVQSFNMQREKLGRESIKGKAFKDYYEIPTDPIKLAKARKEKQGVLSRGQYRQRHADVDARLFLVGEVSDLRTRRAADLVRIYMKVKKIKPDDVESLKKRKQKLEDAREAGIRLPPQLIDLLIPGALSQQMASSDVETSSPAQVPTIETPQAWNVPVGVR